MEVDLCGVQHGFSSKNQTQLERKEDMKRRGMASPDLGDARAMTFGINGRAKPLTRAYEPTREWSWV